MPENIHFDHCFVLLRVVWCERGCYYGFYLKEILKVIIFWCGKDECKVQKMYFNAGSVLHWKLFI